MTSTAAPAGTTLIGAAAPTVGDLVTTTNPAGETLCARIDHVTGDGRYAVRVGRERRFWNPEDCGYTTAQRVARNTRVGDVVYVRHSGWFRPAEVVKVGRTNITVDRPTRGGGHQVTTIPAWTAMRMAW